MEPIFKEFSSITRRGLAKRARAVALSLPKEIVLDRGSSPIIISIDGDFDNGKSLIWDEMAKAIFRLPSFSSKEKARFNDWAGKGFRAYEYHTGFYLESNTPITILFQNTSIDSSAGTDTHVLKSVKDATKAHIPNPRKIADIYLMSNHLKDGTKVRTVTPDIKINLTTQYNVLRPVMTWIRKMRVEACSERLIESTSIREFML